MINLIKTPQRSDNIKVQYEVNGDVLKVIYDDIFAETFDFTGLEEGRAEEIITETLPINPVISAEKVGDTVSVKVIQFYGKDEKHLFEVINNG